MFKKHSVRLILGLTATAACLTACGNAESTLRPASAPTTTAPSASSQNTALPTVAPITQPPISYVPNHSAVSPGPKPADAATAAQQIVTDVRDRLGLSDVVSTQVGSGPANGRSGPWFYATVSCPSNSDGQCVHAIWEADLIQGATAERMNWSSADNLANVLVGSSITASLPDSSQVSEGGDQGNVSASQQFADDDASDAAIEADVRNVITGSGLTVSALQVLHPLGAAIYVVAQLPAKGMPQGETAGGIVQSLLGDPVKYEGYYVELDTAAGRPVIRTAADFRTGAGHLWFDPAYASVTGVQHG